jgi:hypothetical protein
MTETPIAGSAAQSSSIPVWRISLASPATVYFKVYASFSSGPKMVGGRISARRVR